MWRARAQPNAPELEQCPTFPKTRWLRTHSERAPRNEPLGLVGQKTKTSPPPKKKKKKNWLMQKILCLPSTSQEASHIANLCRSVWEGQLCRASGPCPWWISPPCRRSMAGGEAGLGWEVQMGFILAHTSQGPETPSCSLR